MRALTLWTKATAAKCSAVIVIFAALGSMPTSIISAMLTVSQYQTLKIDEPDQSVSTQISPEEVREEYLCVASGPRPFALGYVIFKVSCIYFLPLSVMASLYGATVKALLDEKTRSIQSEKIMRSRKKVVHMLVAMVTVFAICWLPGVAMYVMIGIQGDDFRIDGWVAYAVPVSTFMVYFSCISNPLLYSFMSKQYRKGFKAMFAKFLCCCRNQQQKKTKLMTSTSAPSIFGSDDISGKTTTETTQYSNPGG